MTRKPRQPARRGKQPAAPEPELLSRRKTYELALEGYRWAESFEQPSGKRAAWLEIDIDEWTSAFLLAEQAGEMVVAEVRFFPKEPEPEGIWIDDPTLGRVKAEFWMGDENGPRAHGTWSGQSASVPQGGVPARVLRRVKPGEALRLGFLAARSIPPPEDFKRLAERRYRGKRTKRDDLLLAHVAVVYEQVCREGSQAPSRAVWQHLRANGSTYKRGTVRDLVREARKRGFLADWQHGVGRVATAKAHDLVAIESTGEAG